MFHEMFHGRFVTLSMANRASPAVSGRSFGRFNATLSRVEYASGLTLASALSAGIESIASVHEMFHGAPAVVYARLSP
jgi:hypothetical protein